MNVAVEYDISPAISVLIPFYYSPFNYFTSSRKLRTFCVQPEVRYWFGQVDGLFTGVHIGVASYNYALKNSTYRYQNSDTGAPLLNMGLTAGYRISLGKGGAGVWSFLWERDMLIWIMTAFSIFPVVLMSILVIRIFSASTMWVFQWATALMERRPAMKQLFVAVCSLLSALLWEDAAYTNCRKAMG